MAAHVTLDVHRDSVAVTDLNEVEDRRSIPNSTMDAFSQHSRRSSRSGTMTTQIVHLTFSPDLWIDESNNEGQKPRLEKSLSVAEQAIQGLRFINRATDEKDLDKLWAEVESRFNRLTLSNYLLDRSDFAECIGMKDSKEFALELFDTLSRRRARGRHLKSISKEQLQ